MLAEKQSMPEPQHLADKRAHLESSGQNISESHSSSSCQASPTLAAASNEIHEIKSSQIPKCDEGGDEQEREKSIEKEASPRNGLSPTGTKRGFEEMKQQNYIAKDSLPSGRSIPSQSSIRLSMSLDGAVKVRTQDEETPSPPKTHAITPAEKSRASLLRSKSAISFSDLADGDFSKCLKPTFPGGQFGRSRDARTWEFYCDSDAREALSSHAESEIIGSAVSAISLIRSQRQKARAKIMTEKVSGGSTSYQTTQIGSRAKLSRTTSSTGLLLNVDSSVLKANKPVTVRRDSGGESDKENWEPGTRSSINPLRRVEPSNNRRPILEENRDVLSQSNREEKENRRSVDLHFRSVKDWEEKDEDLDCVQGLLSLSQGGWQ